MKPTDRLTLTGLPVLYVALVLLVVIPVISLIAFQPVVENVWCLQFEIPKYATALGFEWGSITVADRSSSVRETVGISWVDPRGPFGRAGLRSGDIPHMHHGIRDFCGDLSRATDGYAITLEVINVADSTGQAAWRKVVVNAPSP